MSGETLRRPEMARLLAFDAAGSSCSAAVFAEGRLLARRFEAMRRGQAERLVPMLESVLAEAGISFAELDLLAVTTGPGGFTGVRLGLATARGLALALGCPILGLTTFETQAAAALAERQEKDLPDDLAILCLIEAKRADVYYQCLDLRLTVLSEPGAALPETLAERLAMDGLAGRPLLIVGDAAERGAAALRAHGIEPLGLRQADCEAEALGRLALARLNEAGRLPSAAAPAPRPLYLRPADAKPMAVPPPAFLG